MIFDRIVKDSGGAAVNYNIKRRSICPRGPILPDVKIVIRVIRPNTILSPTEVVVKNPVDCFSAQRGCFNIISDVFCRKK